MEENKVLTEERAKAFGLASLIVGITCFLNLLNLEKGIVAIIFGIISLRLLAISTGRRYAIAGIILASVQIIVVVALLILFGDKIKQLIEYLQAFSFK